MLVMLIFSLCACGRVASDTDSWKNLLTHQEQELKESSQVIRDLSSHLPDRLSDFQKRLYLLRSKFERLMLYFNLRSQNPLALRDIMGALGWYEHEVNRLMLPFKQEKEALSRLMENIKALSEKLRQEALLLDQSMPETRQRLTNCERKGEMLLKKAESLVSRLNAAMVSAQTFTSRLETDRTHVQERSTAVLKTHLIKRTQPFFSEAAWVFSVSEAHKWASRFGIYLLEPIELKELGWVFFIGKVLLLSLFLMVIFLGVLKRLTRRFTDLRRFHLRPFVICSASGMGILLGIFSTGLFPSSFFSTTVTVILVYGLLHLSRNLYGESLKSTTEASVLLIPLGPFWCMVSVLSVLVAIHLPEETFIPIWAVWLMVLWGYYAKQVKGGSGWESISRTILLVAFPGLAVMAFLGWGYLSLLLGMLLLLMFVDIRLALGLSAGLGKISFGRQASAASSQGTASGVRWLGFPLVLLTLLLFSFAWIFVFVGGGTLFMEVIRYRMGWDNFTFSIYRIICIFSLLFVVRITITLACKSLARLPERRGDMDPGSVQSLETLVTYALWSLFVIISLGILGISFRNLAVIAGGLSVGLGFGLQNIVNNFIGGLILLFGRSLQPGDLVEIDDIRGHVKKVTIRNTLVKTFSGSTIFVPNSLLISQKMINYSHADRRYRQEIKVGVAYGSNVDQVTELLLEAARQSAKVLDRPPPRVRFLDFGDNTLVFSLRLWIKGWTDRYADSEVRYHIDRIFRDNNIEISFPQLDLHIRSAEGLKNGFTSEGGKN